VPPDEVEVEVKIEIDDSRCEKEEQRSGLAINVGEICAGIVNGDRIWTIGSITRLVIAKGGEAVCGLSSRAMLTFRSKAMRSGRRSSSRTHHWAALGAVIEIA